MTILSSFLLHSGLMLINSTIMKMSVCPSLLLCDPSPCISTCVFFYLSVCLPAYHANWTRKEMAQSENRICSQYCIFNCNNNKLFSTVPSTTSKKGVLHDQCSRPVPSSRTSEEHQLFIRIVVDGHAQLRIHRAVGVLVLEVKQHTHLYCLNILNKFFNFKIHLHILLHNRFMQYILSLHL
jgi:hypothetical protein